MKVITICQIDDISGIGISISLEHSGYDEFIPFSSKSIAKLLNAEFSICVGSW